MTLTKNRVLIVEDDAMTREVMQTLLERSYTVTGVASGKDALSVLEKFNPELILLDVIMPGMDGFEVCRKIREIPRFRSTRIIMVTGESDPEDRVRGYQAGADNYLVKPVRLPELAAVVTSSLRVSRETSPTIEKSRGTTRNCWEVMKCDQDKPGGCPAFTRRLGTMCWLVAGTMCGGKTQGVFAQKYKNCSECRFFKMVAEGAPS